MKCLKFSLMAAFLLFGLVAQANAQFPLLPLVATIPAATENDAYAAYAAIDAPYTRALLSDNAIAEFDTRQKVDAAAFRLMDLDRILSKGSAAMRSDRLTFHNAKRDAATGIANAKAAVKIAKDGYKNGNFEALLGDQCYDNEDWSGAVAHYKAAKDYYLACIRDYGRASIVLKNERVEHWQSAMEVVLQDYGWDGTDLNDF